MRARTTLATALSVAAVGLAAGCGGSGPASSELGGAASVAPSDAVAFVALDTDVSSSQWQAVDGLLKKLPAQGDLLTTLEQSFAKHTKLSWQDDVQPALGSELDLVVLPGTKPQLVALTQPADAAKLAALLPKLGANLVSAQIGAWTAISDTRAALDTVQNAGTKLADNNTYQVATAKLSTDALVRAYANGGEAQQLLDALGTQAPAGTAVPFAWAAADVVAAGDGVRVHGYSLASSSANASVPAQPYAPQLVDAIPAGAILVADFPVAQGQFEQAGTKSVLEKVFGANAATVASELDTILGGETALYVRPGLPIPEVTLVTEPRDPAAATQALPELVRALTQLAGAQVAGLNLGSVHAVVGGRLVVSTTPQGLADFQSAGPKLSGDPSFQSARQGSGLPAETTGFVYANVASALPLVKLAAPLLGVALPPGLLTDAGAVKTLIAFGTRNGDESAVTAFLQLG